MKTRALHEWENLRGQNFRTVQRRWRSEAYKKRRAIRMGKAAR